MEEARAVWQDRITIWGGLPSILLEANVSLEQLLAHLANIYRAIGRGHRFILGISDQAMPSASWTNIAAAARWAKEHADGPRKLP